MKRILFIGDGAWGTALAVALSQKRVEVRLWGAFPDYVEEVRKTRENTRFLPGVSIPRTVALHADPAKAADGIDLAVVSTPTQYVRTVLGAFREVLPPAVPVLSVAKGLEVKTRLRPSQVATDVLGRRTVGVLSGPSHAEEAARGVPTAVVAASRRADFASAVQRLFMTDCLRVYTNGDILGVELGAALKNIIAIAAGISDGLGFGDNTKAALVTRGLAEITRLGRDLGAKAATFQGLSGLGDLLTTCASRHSRNRWCGEQVGKGQTLASVLASTPKIVEGVATTKAVHRLAGERGLEMPIVREVYRVLYRGKSPARAVRDLMTRKAKAEG